MLSKNLTLNSLTDPVKVFNNIDYMNDRFYRRDYQNFGFDDRNWYWMQKALFSSPFEPT